ncbi:TonB-dependent receptor [Sphingoaurantiacus capsulatus]|uniref:TonB-dependent receptor n=1 Tax=Sphingoaurantiacus capsulatus TaxID=1771310 RepID=A0ABV7XB04_9SPHN
MSAAADDQTVIEDIIVTARRRAESAQSIPVAVTAIGGDKLEEMTTVRLSDIAALAPSIKVTSASGSANAPVIFIRGIGTITTAMYAEPSVGLYVDGVYMPRPSGNAFDLPDVERLEVLRGPQGTLFGRNTTGGAVLITTQTPRDEASGKVTFGYGTNNEVIVGGIIHTGEIGDSGFKAKIAGQIHNRDGWVESPNFNPSDWGGNEKGVNFNAALVGEIGNLRIDNRARYAKIDSFTSWEILGGTPAALAAYTSSAAANPAGPPFVVSGNKPRDFSYRDPRSTGNAEIEGYGNVLTLDYEFSEAASLKSITAYQVLDQDLSIFLGGSFVLGRVINPRVVGNPIEPVSVHVTTDNPGHQKQFSQEFQLAGDLGDFNYLGGLFIYDERVSETINTELGSVATTTPITTFIRVNRSVPYSQKTKSWAGFGQLSFQPQSLDDRLEISAGLRYTKDTKDEESRTIATTTTTTTTSHTAKDSWDNWGYAGSISYKFAPSIMAFGRIASSYRAGGFNNIAVVAAPYDPEKALSYEAGIKTDLFDRRVRFNATVYKTDYDDLQITQLVTTPNAAGGTTSTSFISNAAKAEYKGFELEGTALLGEHFQIDGNIGYIDPKYNSYNFVVLGVPTDVTAEANFAYVPTWTTHIGAAVNTGDTSAGKFTFRADYSQKSSTDLASVDRLSPTVRNFKSGKDKDLSARIIWTDIPVGDVKLTAQIYGENLTNNRFINFATDFSSLATVVFNRPRNYGIRISAEF